MRLLLLSQTAPAETAAMLIEPVLGEGGYVPAPTAFLQGLEAICREHGILFIADEVQSGFGRTGTMFCVEQHGIRPDVVVMAKGLASGFPISAVGASAELMARWPTGQPRRHLRRQPDRVRRGHRHDRRAHRATASSPTCRRAASSCGPGCAAWPRRTAASSRSAGPGLMVACQLADAARVPRLLEHCLAEGRLILMNAGTFGDAIRWMPPAGGQRGRDRPRPRRLRQGPRRHSLSPHPRTSARAGPVSVGATMAAVEVDGLTVRYGDVTAVTAVSFEAQAGQITAVLGPNGAGKTTTIEVLEGFRRPDARADVGARPRSPGRPRRPHPAGRA